MRLIDADRLRNEVLKWMPSDPCGIVEKEHPFETDIVVSLMMEIEDAPTIEPKTKAIAQITFDDDKLREIVNEAVERFKEEYDIVDNPDAVSVVRCKECKWWDDSDHCPCVVEAEGCRYITDLGNDGFCSYGERKGSE